MRYKKRHKPRRKKIQYQGHTMASESEVRFAKEGDRLKIKWTYEPTYFDW